MDPLVPGGLGFAVMLGLIAQRVPIGIATGFVGMGGFALTVGWGPAPSLPASEPAATLTNLNLAVILLFMPMGNTATAGLANDVYNIAHALIGHRKGGLATATILDRGDSPSLATGSIAAGETLGIIVPPSTINVLDAILTEQLVVELFTAALIPALLSMVCHAGAVRLSRVIPPRPPPKSNACRCASASSNCARAGAPWSCRSWNWSPRQRSLR